jgi:hypothetical protein
VAGFSSPECPCPGDGRYPAGPANQEREQQAADYDESGGFEGSGSRSHVMRNVVIRLAFE